MVCPDGQYFSNFQCEDCPSKCKSCKNKNVCLECSNNYISKSLNSKEGVICETCPKGYSIKSNKCVGNFY